MADLLAGLLQNPSVPRTSAVAAPLEDFVAAVSEKTNADAVRACFSLHTV